MTLTMLNAGEKPGVESPNYIVTSQMPEPAVRSGGVQKKHILIAVSVVVVIGLAIAGILVGMHMFSEAQKEIVKFSMQFKTGDNQDAKQDVVSDPNDNVVMFHVTKPGQDIYIVNDFNKDLQVVKIETSDSTNCYISPLNRSQAMDPSQITGAASLVGSHDNAGQTYMISNTPVSDTSFLPKKAKDMCKGVSIYWAYRHCGQQIPADHNTTSPADRNKRTLYYMGKYNGLPGLGGCCRAVYACTVRAVETVYSNGVHQCDFYYQTGTCCSVSAYCNYVYVGYWQTPGLNC